MSPSLRRRGAAALLPGAGDRAQLERRWTALLAVLLWATASRAARAEERNEPAVRRRTPPVLVEAVRPAELPQDPSAFTTVIEMDELRDEVRSVPSLIGDTVGVQVRQFGGPGDPSEISIRGSSANQVVVLLDGVRLNTAQSGTVDLSTLPPELIERIEITRGGGSIQTGSDAIGGVVNIVTRRPSAELRTAISGLAGSFGTWGGSISQTGAWHDFEFSGGYQGFATDGDWKFKAAERVVDGVPLPTPPGTFTRVNNDDESHSALVSAGRDLGEAARVSLSDSFLYQEGGVPGPDAGPGALLGQSLTARRRFTRNLANLLLEVRGEGDSRPGGQLRFFHRFDRSQFEDPVPRLGGPVDSDNRNHSLGERLELDRVFQIPASQHTASLGAEHRYDFLRSDDFSNPDRHTLGVFVQDEVALLDARLEVIPALRLDRTQGFGSEWIPRLGAVAEPWRWLRLKGNLERSYRVPNFDELFFDEEFVRGNPFLDPEDAVNADVGLELGFDRLGPVRDVWLEFSAFRNDIDESIVFQPISQNVIAATNTGAATAEGIELAGRLSAFDWLAFAANWTHLDSNVKATNQPLPGRAEDEFLLRLEIEPPGGWFKLAGDRRYTSRIPTDATGSAAVGSRAIYDVSLALHAHTWPWLGRLIPGRQLVFSVTASNVTDQSVRDAVFFPQPGRSLAFRLEWQR